jgi:hypothetical protein
MITLKTSELKINQQSKSTITMKKLDRLYIAFLVFIAADVAWIAATWAYLVKR